MHYTRTPSVPEEVVLGPAQATRTMRHHKKPSARSLFDLFAIVQRINQSGAVFRWTAEPWADDTGTNTGWMMFAVMAGKADVERDLTRTRGAEGRARATARGQHMGRPPKVTQRQRREGIARRDAGEAVAEIARTYNVNRMTITRLKP
jgi:DNA invertase Pin-like site-specific DNA recombinase